MNWPYLAIGDACNVRRGTTITQTQSREGIVPVVAGGLNATYYHDTPNRRGNVITISASGANAGFVNFWSSPIFASDCSTVETDGEDVDIKFVYYFLRSKQDYINSKLRSGAAQPHVYAKDIAQLQLPLPPVTEQHRIAAILDQADALRAKRREALAQPDSLTQSIFIEMFGDDAQGVPRFPVSALVDVLETPLQNGAYYPKEEYTLEGGVEMVHMSDAFNGIVQRGELKRVICSEADLRKYSLSESDILLARRSLTYEGAAKPCLVPQATEKLIFESSFIRVTPARTKVLVAYLFHYLGNETIRDKRVRPFVTQSTISGINQSNLERVPVVVPPLHLQETFATRIQAIEHLKASHNAALQELDRLFASLQHRAFSGEL